MTQMHAQTKEMETFSGTADIQPMSTIHFSTAPKAQAAAMYSVVQRLAEWQNKALTDYSSSTIQPSEPHVVDTTDHVNGWRLAAESQIIGKGIALPDDLAPLLVDFDGEPRPVTWR